MSNCQFSEKDECNMEWRHSADMLPQFLTKLDGGKASKVGTSVHLKNFKRRLSLNAFLSVAVCTENA